MIEEIEQSNCDNHWEIADITHGKQLTEHWIGQLLAEEQCWLIAEKLLFPRGEDMVKIREDAVELKGLRIPYSKE